MTSLLPGLFGLALLLAPAAAPPPPAEPDDAGELHRSSQYPGAAAFVTVGTLTVVYPAGPGEPVEVNRRSAEARARWLASVHKNKVEVAADDQVTDEQRRGNLLILGWQNRIWGGKLSRPFKHGESGTSFLGLTEQDPDVDLLVFYRNPLETGSFVLFWSRIDAERDRFQVLPRVGSDWAMYRDYWAVRQGMFRPGRAWPPARDTSAEGDHTLESFASAASTGTFDSEHYHVFFDKTKIDDAEIRAIGKARESALAKAVAGVGPLPKGFRVLLYVYEDETAKKRATGVADPTHAVLTDREIHMVRRFAHSPAPHEEIHLLARETYGPCASSAVYEGFALSVENLWHGDSMDMHAAMLKTSGMLPDPAALLDEERFRALPGDSGLPAAGVFMSWLRESYGEPGVRKAFALRTGEIAELAAALGTTEPAMGAQLAAWADRRVAAKKSELDFIAAERKAQGKQMAGDWKGMAEALQEALRAKPDEPQTLFNLASAQMRGADLTGAEATLKRLLGLTLSPEASRFRIFGHYQLGRVYDLAGRRTEALAEYDKVLGLPDDHGAHDLARERKMSPATREQLE